MERKFKKCTKCGEPKPLSHFRKTGGKSTHEFVRKQHYMSKCKSCEFKERQNKKFETKAANTISNHAAKLGVSVEQMHNWGITNEYVAWLFLREWTLYTSGFNSCPNCYGYGEGDGCWEEITKDAPGEKIRSLTRGDFHLDIIDKERVRRTGVLTRSNCRIICKTANNAKGSKDPTEYDLEVMDYDNDKKAVKKGVQFGLSVEAKIIPPKEKPAIHEAGEQLRLFVS